MLQKIRNSRWSRIMSIGVAMNFLFEFCIPLQSVALTSGPEQPEMKAFTPVSTDDMVDLFTGDFHYNIPLLTVPGPNGGYPINLAYNAGITMEQEASWVGLGWNVNMGCINRNMRGLPDDFAGEVITKEYSMKPNWTVGVGLNGIGVEVFGIPAFDAKTGAKNKNPNAQVSAQLYYNSYKGFGIKAGLGLKNLQSDALGGAVKGDLNLSFDSQGGLGVSPNLSLSAASEFKKQNEYQGTIGGSFGIGCNLNSRQGMSNLWMSSSANANYSTFRQAVGPPDSKGNLPGYMETELNISSAGPGVSFGTASYVPSVTMPMKTFSIDGTVKLGPSAGVFANLTVNANFSRQAVIKDPYQVPAFGLMYYHLSTTASMRDFNREKDVPVNKHSKNLPIPVMTYDVFSVTGQNTGGVFRLYRSDIPVLSDMAMTSKSNDGEIGFDLGTIGVANHLGVNLAYSHNKSYSGQWRKGYDGLNTVIDPTLPSQVNYEPYYFRMTGDKSENCLDQYNSIHGSESARFDVYINNLVPKTRNVLNDQFSIGIPKRTTRERRTQHVGIMTMEEKMNDPVKESYNNKVLYPYSEKKPKQIAEITVTNPDGNKYIYGIAAYNKLQKDVNFSIANKTGNTINTKSTTYTNTEASTANKSGADQLYMSTSMPPYAHSYLLTRIVSPDYVDLAPPGPSDNDLGYWVKFNYKKVHDSFKWRMPYKNANYSRGYDTDENDDKASFTYGEKEIWYLDSVETKTHVAIFYLSERKDGKGAQSMNATAAGSQSLYKLDSIKLFSKSERNIPLKTVHFRYNYALCWNVENNENYSPASTTVGENGKLTLKSLWFSYENNRKGRFSPYIFDYNETDPIANPKYSPLKMDRWGYYDTSNIATFPYVKQGPEYKDIVDQWMGVWNLKKIHLPSGSNIIINYEADDYAYVQNKRSMQMMKITAPNNAISVDLKSKDLKVYFIPNKPTDSINDYIAGLKDNLVYFKVYSHLKANLNKIHYDYVEGYGKILPDECGKDQDGHYIKFEVIDANKVGLETNPIRLAAWQYIKMQRQDILYPAVAMDNGFIQVANTIGNLFNDIRQLITGYYNAASGREFARHFLIDDSHPSFIRLNNPDKIKRGGGHRVKSISLVDNWVQPRQAEYTTEYTYRTIEDGREISSGVAEWEPMIGGEENPFHYPLKYHMEKLFRSKNAELYVEEPFGESYYPAPSVGYSKVLVNTKITGIKAANGIQLAEYYTARDFPVMTKQTEIDFERFPQIPIPIPTIGYVSHGAYGYSQGYTIMLNDMHGKNKRMATYRPWTDMNVTDLLRPEINQEPVSKTEYIYNTKHPYTPGSDNELSNTVTVLHGDADSKEGKIGLTYDNFIDMRENYDFGFTGGLLPNVDQMAILVVPIAWPKLEISSSIFRTIVYTKVINRMGILMETRAYKDGALTATRNLMVDSETGEPTLTVVTSDFSDNTAANIYNNPYYSYNMPAHWYYPQMRGKYKNARAAYDQSKNSADTNNYRKGDAILFNNAEYWLTEFNSDGENIFKGSDGNTPSNIKGNIISGYTNQLAAPAANIVSLTNPVADRRFPLFEGFNIQQNYPQDFQIYETFKYKRFNFTDCFGEDVSSCAIYDKQNKKISFTLCPPFESSGGGSATTTYCEAILKLDSPILPHQPWFNKMVLDIVDLNLDGIDDLYLQTYSPSMVLTNLESHTWENPNNCFCPETPLELDNLTWTVKNGIWTTSKDIIYDCNQIVSSKIIIEYYYPEGKFVFKREQSGSIVFPPDPEEPNPCFPLDTLCDCEAWVELDAEVVNLPESPDGWKLYKKGDKVEFVGTDKTITGVWHDPENCHTECLDGVIRTGATEFSENWLYNYEDVKIQEPYPNNDYAGGRKGIFRPLRDNVYFIERIQRKGDPGETNPQTNVQLDGTYDVFTFFNYKIGNDVNQQKPWTWASEITKYSPYGFDIENRNALNIYSAALYGYKQSLATAVAANAGYYEIAFDGFEEFTPDATQNGHFIYDTKIFSYITDEESHTGDKSLKISPTGLGKFKISIPNIIANADDYPATSEVSCVSDKEYLISGWIKGYKNQKYSIEINGNSNPLIPEQPIEGWQRFEVVFKAPASSFDIIITCTSPGIDETVPSNVIYNPSTGGQWVGGSQTITESTQDVTYTPSSFIPMDLSRFYLDDVRLHPFNAGMKTYVYDPRKLRTVAELDDNNFATFYNYDSEGTLVQVKKETVRGIMTLKTTRQNIMKNPLIQ